MQGLRLVSSTGGDCTTEDTLFSLIADDIEQQGYSIKPTALPDYLLNSLSLHQQSMSASKFQNAGIGRGDDYLKNAFVRTDEICWITGNSDAGQLWIDWATRLQTFLNQRLFLGLFSFESHFAHYGPGAYYKRHYDAFRGESNRVLSVVVYLNSGWMPDDGGELVLYQNDLDRVGIRVTPLMGTIVVFLSEEFPHEVMATHRNRYSIAGWYRVNTSNAYKVDPPI